MIKSVKKKMERWRKSKINKLEVGKGRKKSLKMCNMGMCMCEDKSQLESSSSSGIFIHSVCAELFFHSILSLHSSS